MPPRKRVGSPSPARKAAGSAAKRAQSPKRAKSPAAKRAKSPASKRSPSPKSPVFNDSPASKRSASPSPKKEKSGANFSSAMGAGSPVPFLLVALCPIFSQVLTFISMDARLKTPTLQAFIVFCQSKGWGNGLWIAITSAGYGDMAALKFIGGFMLFARLLCHLPGPIKCGPLTATGHLPEYIDNGMLHCIFFSTAFLYASFGLAWFDLGEMYDCFQSSISMLNIFGLVFCVYLTWKGLNRPTTQDNGSSGSLILDYYWGTELYPKCLGIDVKRFVNCRFSMTFWQLAGICFTYRSFTKHGALDWGLAFGALSQYIYLCKFFHWEIGYMRSIDIIVDRAGFYETWGCLVWVPSVYTLHSRILVRSPSDLSFNVACGIFLVGLLGVLLNYWADMQRQRFRERDGKMLVWGKEPVFIKARYLVNENGVNWPKESLLLASGFWGQARHLHYLFELTAAWSWCLLANPMKNGCLVLFYCVFLTILLIHRGMRDDEKCTAKYGADYMKYKKLVPYKIVPYIY